MLRDLSVQSGKFIILRMCFMLHNSLWKSYCLVWFISLVYIVRIEWHPIISLVKNNLTTVFKWSILS